MRHPALDSLLILQDRDSRRLGLEAQIKAIPTETAGVEKKREAEKAAIEASRAELRDLETKKKLLETEIGSAEQKLAKYKTQQMSVRKNDEFQALGHEIETTQAAIGVFEEQEIGVMLSIDEARLRFQNGEKAHKQMITGFEERLKNLRERDTNLKAELKEAQGTVAEARKSVSEPALRLYDRVAARHQAVSVVPIRGAKCSGCHLKVSSEVEAEARKGENLITCDQCGRIVWFES
jgi:hypothetical protein